MPRRRALTGAQLEDLLALPAAEADLVRHWTLGDADLAAIDRRRGDHNRLGFALQLCALRYPGRLLRPGEVIPEPALRFVADQLGAAPEALAAYAARPQTRREQLDALREAFGFRSSRRPPARDRWLGCCPWRSPPRTPRAVAAALMDELRRRRIIVPGPPSSSVWSRPRWCWPSGTSPTSSPRPDRRRRPTRSTRCWQPSRRHRMSVLAWARQPPGAPGHRALARLVEQLGGCARSASTPPAPRASTPSACASWRARAGASPPSICGRCRRSAAAPLWSPRCSTPSRA